MKTKLSTKRIRLFILFLALCPAPLALCQVPQGFNYQAIARDGTGNILANQALPVKIAVMDAQTGGNVIYEESFPSITSNQFGLITLIVGTGTPVTGTFSTIDWKSKTLYLRTKIEYPSGNWIDMGTSPIMSVPYSLVAKDVEGPLTKLGITGSATSGMEEALFEVKNKAGNTVFAVYNEGVRAYVGNGDTKGAKGGFAVGGYDATKGSGTLHDLFVLNTDSASFYLDSNPHLKGARGGFSVGGYDMSKGGIPVQNYLHISRDSARIYVDSNPSTKGARGGFSVGGYDMTKDDNAITFTSLTPDNYFIGHKSGILTTGLYNSFLGYETGIIKSKGEKNVLIGYHSGMNNVDASYNVFVGNEAGSYNQGNYNTFMGYQAGYTNSTGMSNVFIGYTSGQNNTEGSNNVFLGVSCGSANKKGGSNVFVGSASGNSNTDGSYNVFMGNYSGTRNKTGNSNIFIGSESGFNNDSGGNNVFMGTSSGYTNKTGTSNVMIGYLSGYLGTDVYSNVFLGDSAGYGNTSNYNVFLGKGTGKANSGLFNTFIGYESGLKNMGGGSNVFIGNQSGFNNLTGDYNVLIGFETGYRTSSDYNSFIGYKAGRNYTSGSYNTYIGYQAGMASATLNGTGVNNVAMGYDAGWKITSGYNNVIIGSLTGNNLTSGFDNIFIGNQAGNSLTGGDSNVAIGLLTGAGLTTNSLNTLVGEKAGFSLAAGTHNVFYGSYAGYLTNGPNENTFIGYDCGYSNITGVGNTYVGWRAGRQTHGSYNVFIGRAAGMNEDGDYKLYIDQNSTSTPLIWGDFTDGSEKLDFNAKVGINTNDAQYSLEARGTNAAVISNYSGQARGGTAALSGARLALLTTASTDDLVLGYTSTTDQASFSSNFVEQMRIDNGTGNVGIGTTSPTRKLEVNGTAYISGDFFIGGNTYDYAPLNVEKWQGICAWFNRRNTDGEIIQFAQSGTTVGSISVASGVVSYNAFTGSHYGVSSDNIEEGKLVVMNGSNTWLHGKEGSEVLYGISENTKANDPAVMGAYLGILESSKPNDNNNPYLIMADGNGEMWVADNGQNLSPGDMLISSDIKGHAMKDIGQFAESYVIAKVAEPVDWQNVTETIDGVKHRKVSVLFTSFVRNNNISSQSTEVEELKTKVSHLEKLVEQLMSDK
jgi:hypothetical protein